VYDVTDKAIGLKMLSYITIPEIKSMVLHSIGISSNSNNVYLRFVALIALYKVFHILFFYQLQSNILKASNHRWRKAKHV
jgi:hypothetical protein